MATTSSWTDIRVEALKKMWADGLTGSVIASRLGGVTRNAVIGKVHRLGLPARATTSRMVRRARRARGEGIQRKPWTHGTTIGNPALRKLYLAAQSGNLPTAEELLIPLEERKQIATLTASCCRWPIGDPKATGFHFCGRSRMASLPYCDVHALRAFEPPRTPRRGGHAAPSAHSEAMVRA